MLFQRMSVPARSITTLIVAVLLSLHSAQLPAVTTRPLLIEFGWDEPSTDFMRRHIGEMEKTPFDGTVFHIDYKTPGGVVGRFTNECWGHRVFTEADMRKVVHDLRSTQFTRLRHNFLRFNVTPGDIDWFENFAPVTMNARLAAKVANTTGCAGILFDIEQYALPVFDYRTRPTTATHSFDDYAKQVRLRGRELMQGFQEGYPGLTILLTYGYSLPWIQTDHAKKPLAEVDYGLLPALLDGMLDVADPNVRIIDGYEVSYGFKEARQFDNGKKEMTSDVLSLVADPHKYAQHFRFGFGIWMDNNWRTHGWRTDNVDQNYFSPGAFENSVRAAMQRTDTLVWIYTETPKWWTENGPDKLPASYSEALRRAAEIPARITPE